MDGFRQIYRTTLKYWHIFLQMSIFLASLGPVIPNQEWFCLPEVFDNVWIHVWLSQLRGHCWLPVDKSGKCCSTSHNAQDSPQNKVLSSSNVNSTKPDKFPKTSACAPKNLRKNYRSIVYFAQWRAQTSGVSAAWQTLSASHGLHMLPGLSY